MIVVDGIAMATLYTTCFLAIVTPIELLVITLQV